MGFKRQLKKDVENTFFNLDEFGENAIINDKEMTIIMDNEQLQQINLAKQPMANPDKIAMGALLFHKESSNFEHIPQVEKLMKFNDETYRINDVKEEEKVLTIILGRYSG